MYKKALNMVKLYYIIYIHDKVEICKLESGSYTETYNASNLRGYYNFNNKPSVLVESADRVVFCYGDETIWTHSYGSNGTTVNLYCTEIK